MELNQVVRRVGIYAKEVVTAGRAKEDVPNERETWPNILKLTPQEPRESDQSFIPKQCEKILSVSLVLSKAITLEVKHLELIRN